jgi:hypothetical protein
LTVAFDLGRLSGPGRAQPNSTTERLLRENGALEKPPPAEWTLVLQLFTRDSPRNYAEFEVLEVGWPWATSRCISIEYLAHFMHVRPSALEGFRMGEADERPWYSPVSSNFGAGYSIAPTHVLWVPAAMNTGFFGSLVFAVSSIACGPRATSHPESPSVPPLHLVRVLAKGAPLAQCRMP